MRLPDLNLRVENDPAALPEQPESTFRWATVISIGPLVIKFDGDSVPISATPDTLDPSLVEGDRVWCHLYGRSIIVLGKGSRI